MSLLHSGCRAFRFLILLGLTSLPLLAELGFEVVGGQKFRQTTLSAAEPRCLGLASTLLEIPDFLKNAPCLILERPSTPTPFLGLKLRLAEPARVVLVVQKRGQAGMPAAWIKRKESLTWSFGSFTLHDEIYERNVAAGEVLIPGHQGKEGDKYGLPHLICLLPRAAPEKAGPGVRLGWPERPATGEPMVSKLWIDFTNARAQNKPTLLPDFSYAGYERGEKEIVSEGKLFPVTEYGALPDDAQDDAAGIRRAIAAAAQQGGGVVYFPAGRYLVCCKMSDRQSILITNSRIILRGAGCTQGGSVIHQVLPFERGLAPDDPNRLHLGDTVFTFIDPDAKSKTLDSRLLARVSAPADAGALSLELDDATRLQPGQWLALYCKDSALFQRLLDPCQVDARWKTIIDGKATAAELHQVASVAGRRVTLKEPIAYAIDPALGWKLSRFEPLSNVGVEDLCFMGSAYGRYAHHRSDIDDSGWAMLRLDGVVNSWVQRCSFINASHNVLFSKGLACTMRHLFTLGNGGHHTTRVTTFATDILGAWLDDRSGCTHGPSINNATVDTVYWNIFLRPDEPMDSHAGRPLNTLWDKVRGGDFNKSGGGERDFPHHLRGLVVWNFLHRRGLETGPAPFYDFMSDGRDHDSLLFPIFVGLHGSPAYFNEYRLGAYESPGRAVKPDSLYEAQLALRLGQSPAWIAACEKEYARLAKCDFPPFISRKDRQRPSLLHVETFEVKTLLDFLARTSLEMNHSAVFQAILPNAPLTLRSDENTVRTALYALMNIIYAKQKTGNTLACQSQARQGKTGLRFTLRSGKALRPFPGQLEQTEDYVDTQTYAAWLGGEGKMVNDEGCLGFELWIPSEP